MRGTPPHSSSCARRPERRHQLLEGNGAATGRRAYEALPEGLRARVVGLLLQHQASHGSPGQRRPGGRDLASDDPRDLPGAIRPIASTHPETGRNALFRGRRFGSCIPPVPLEESEALLNDLWAHATRDEFA